MRAKLAAVAIAALLATCVESSPAQPSPPADDRADERARMVAEQMRDVRDPRVLAAMRAVPRHRFVPPEEARFAYDDRPLSIGHGQTISQPYIVALMTELADVTRGERVLEIGTGSGYQAAILAELGAEVYTIEIVRPLGERAAALLRELGYANVRARIGDGYRGWPEHAPFDAILLTAAPPEIPRPLLDQLAVGGRLVAPVGTGDQELVVVRRTEQGYS
ncbi:MAG TPA: protein-L-isoaspartate(D-aspartate) O-methyltransferase, partial [Sandaracinaceae bacterium]